MFDWFWEFLYSITKSMLRIIDGVMACANKLCGIEDITVNGEGTDFLTYLLRSQKVTDAFIVAAVLGLIVLVFFTILAIIRLMVKEKPDMSPAQVCVKSFKSVLTFLFIPAIMIIGVWVANVFMQALYKATLTGSSSLGSFLFTAFGDDAFFNKNDAALFINGTLDYTNTDVVLEYMNLENFDFFASWVASAVILWNIAWALLVFVDRAISIVILYIVSPFPVAVSVLDDGSHFKLWREQMLTKFFVGFGTILAINIYCLIVLLVMDSSMQFFSSSFLNNLCKILFIIGGSLTMKKAMALVGNLVSSGGGSNELRDNAFAGNFLGSGLKMIAGVAAKPFTWGAERAGNAINRGVEDKIGNKLFGSRYGGGNDGTTGDGAVNAGGENNNDGDNVNHNDVARDNDNNVGDVIRNGGDNNNERGNENNNNIDNNVNQNRQDAVLNAMNNNENNIDNDNNLDEDMR